MAQAMAKYDKLIAEARKAAKKAYAPHSEFRVGAALLFDDGKIVTGANVENASYGLTLCAETVAVGKAMAAGRRGGLVAVAVIGSGKLPVTPCGRCRQMLNELAALGKTDPLVLSCAAESKKVVRSELSKLLPDAFGPQHLD
jgi:cytidine deaminase